MSIPPRDISVNEYLENFLKVMASFTVVCPICGSPVHIHSYYLRWFIPAGSLEKIQIWIERVKCTNKNCGRTHAILPGFIHPYHRNEMSVAQRTLQKIVQYGKSVTEAIMLQIDPVSCAYSARQAQLLQWVCENRETAAHWVYQFHNKADEVAGRLRQVAAKYGCEISPLKEPEAPWEKIVWLVDKLIAITGIEVSGLPIFSIINHFLSTVARKGNDHIFL